MKPDSRERGSAMVETAITLPILLVLMVGIFEVGRAYETWQVLTNAAREGARIAVLPDTAAGDAEARVRQYLTAGQLKLANDPSVTVTVDPNVDVAIGAGTAKASLVTVSYPFDFVVLQPVARLLVSGSKVGEAITMKASAQMRNESQ